LLMPPKQAVYTEGWYCSVCQGLTQHAKTPDGLACTVCRTVLPGSAAKQREYFQRPEVKAKQREYFQRPEVKAKKREYNQRYRSKIAEKMRAKRRAPV